MVGVINVDNTNKSLPQFENLAAAPSGVPGVRAPAIMRDCY
jgi:hypothetical protein